MLSPLPTQMSMMVTNAEWIRDRCLYVVSVVLEQNIRASDSNPWCGPTWSPTNTDFEGAPISQQVISHSRFDLCSCSVERISFHCDDTYRSRSVPGHRLRALGLLCVVREATGNPSGVLAAQLDRRNRGLDINTRPGRVR